MKKLYEYIRSTKWLRGGLLICGLSLMPATRAQVGTSLSFDGVNDYVSIPGSRALSSAAFTVEFWVKLDALPRQKAGVVDKGYTQHRNWYFLQDANSLDLIFGVGQSFGTSELNIQLGDHQWHHVAGTYDGRTLRAYLDGVEVGSMSGSMSLDASQGIRLGEQTNGAGNFAGHLDELRVWNKVITAREMGRGMYRRITGNPRNLVGYWPMDEGDGTRTNDAASLGNHGTLVGGPAWKVSGAWIGTRTALDFDGRNDHLVVSDHRDLDLTHDFTIETWVKLDQFGRGFSRILDKGDGYGLSVGEESIRFSVYNRRNYDLEYTLPLGEWVHLAVVMDRSNDVTLYVNGRQVATQGGEHPCFTNNTSLYIGGGSFGFSDFLDGQIDELRIWHRARSQARIQADMYRTLEGDEPQLAAYYRFDQTGDASQNVAYDYTGHGHDAALTRMNPAAAWVPASPFSTWIGSEDGNWNNPNNWSGLAVPTHQPVGLYPWGLAHFPSNGNISLDQCFIAEGVAMNHGGVLTLTGDLINHGALANTGTVRFEGSKPQVIQGEGQTLLGTLVVDNPAGVAVEQDLTVSGDMELDRGTLSLGVATLTLLGDIAQGDGSLQGSTEANLVVGGGGNSLALPALLLNDLTLTRRNGLTLEGELTVLGTFYLQRGQVDLNGERLVFDENASLTGNFNSETHILALDGTLRKRYGGPGEFTFPVGDGIYYTPITLDFAHGNFTAAYLDVGLAVAQHPQNSSSSHYLNRYWIVNSSGLSAFSCDVTAVYDDDDVVGTESELVGAKWDGVSWLVLGGVDAFRNQITGTIHGFSDFTAGEASTFPVEWLGFEAQSTGDQVSLQWKTAMEINSHYFGVERSTDQQSWEEVGRVTAAGQSEDMRQYDYRDQPPQSGQWYYRLRQVDLDGSFSYSPQVAVSLSGVNFSAYPNPVQDRLYIQAEGAWSGELQDFSGRVIARYQGEGNQTLNLSALAAGTYVLRVNLSGQPRVISLTKE